MLTHPYIKCTLPQVLVEGEILYLIFCVESEIRSVLILSIVDSLGFQKVIDSLVHQIRIFP